MSAALDPATAVGQAIAAQDFATEGAPFGPLLMKLADPKDFRAVWDDPDGSGFSVYQWQGDTSDGWASLGDVLSAPDGRVGPVYIFKAAPGHEDALAHPVSLGGGTYVPLGGPAGYVGVGAWCTAQGGLVESRYWCVKEEYVELVGSQPCPLFGHIPTLQGASLRQGKFIFVPQVIISGDQKPFALVLDKCFLPVTDCPTPSPTYDPTFESGQTTSPGVGNVAVLMCTTIGEDALATPQSSPFYYLAAQPYWTCLGAFASGAGGSLVQDVQIGSASSSSSSFAHSTSLTVSADEGISYSLEGLGVHFGVSSDYTTDMSLSVFHSESHSTEVDTKVTVSYPPAPNSLVWQRMIDLNVYRTDGSVLSDVIYQAVDTRVTQGSLAG